MRDVSLGFQPDHTLAAIYGLPQTSMQREMGWAELANGELLTVAETAGFAVMITGDKNLSYQQNLQGRELALVVLSTNDWNVLKQNPRPVTDAGGCGEAR
jgi:hypothetical protein